MRRRLLLARLALTPNVPVGREELLDLLWGRAAPAAMSLLHTQVSRLRRIFGTGPRDPQQITLEPGGYRLGVEQEHLDLLEFRGRIALGRRLTGADPQRAFQAYFEAQGMFRSGRPAEDLLELREDPLVTVVLDETVDAAVELADLGEILDRQPEVLPILRRLTAQHPWHEALHARLISALATTGQQAPALEAYERIRSRLAEELGIDPGPELTEARQAVLEQRSRAPHRTPGAGAPRLGARRDQSRPASMMRARN
ncbi:hypothetical protein GCM10025331_07560 [Actinoplanes utahensis]|uniref:OmpR/PhoB-type domain-containing protein n=1 Tax=Actinoplanes utahensis TaxID=1869 RepID=A0A0A6UL92_ACTUT|nr:hypothetical protein MB27_25295 [Actinoplanes utahensis]GIF28496.1 hypothetical protein Aut01nite_14820 [Actinoplanes utahensis]